MDLTTAYGKIMKKVKMLMLKLARSHLDVCLSIFIL